MSPQSGGQATEDTPTELLASVIEAAQAAAHVIRRHTPRVGAVVWQEKSPQDFVSEVDHGAEEAIRAVLSRRHPSAVIVGEELSPEDAAQAASAPLCFVADPLDGTTNFLHGYPAYAVSVAALRAGEIAAGCVLNVPTGELFTAVAGGGALRDGVPIRVSTIEEPLRALVGTGFPFKHGELVDAYMRQFPEVLRATAGVRRAGAAALDLADVACGRFDAFWELMLAPWDIAAGILLVREAGGIVTDLTGRPAAVTHTPIVAGNPAMHRWLLGRVGGDGTSSLSHPRP